MPNSKAFKKNKKIKRRRLKNISRKKLKNIRNKCQLLVLILKT